MKKALVIIILLSVTGLSAGSYKQRQRPAPTETEQLGQSIDDQSAKLDKLLTTLKHKR